jgi:hypothetical protein
MVMAMPCENNCGQEYFSMSRGGCCPASTNSSFTHQYRYSELLAKLFADENHIFRSMNDVKLINVLIKAKIQR